MVNIAAAASHRPQHEPAGGDRYAGVPLRALAVVVLAAGGQPGAPGGRGAHAAATVDALKGMGHKVAVGADWSEGRLTAASQDGGILKAAANPRGMQGYATGR